MTAPQQVASTAKDQAAEVLSETFDQAMDLAGTVRTQVTEQLSTQGERLTQNLRSLSEQLSQGDTSGVVGQVLTEAGQRLQQLVDRVERTGPQGLVTDARSYVKRSPGTFLIGAVLAGLVTGRVAKGVKGATTPSTSTPPGGTAAGDPLAGRTTPVGTGVTAGYAPSTEPGVSYETADVDPTPLVEAYPDSLTEVRGTEALR